MTTTSDPRLSRALWTDRTALSRAACVMAAANTHLFKAWIKTNKTGGLDWWVDTTNEAPPSSNERDGKFRATPEDIFDWNVEFGMTALRSALAA